MDILVMNAINNLKKSLSSLVTTTNKGLMSPEDKTKLDNTQSQLVSGTNIKTLNNSSILGSGNIILLDAYASAQTGGYTDTLENFYLDLAAMQNLAATLEALL